MKIGLLWFSGCPVWQETDARLRQALPLGRIALDERVPTGVHCPRRTS